MTLSLDEMFEGFRNPEPTAEEERRAQVKREEERKRTEKMQAERRKTHPCTECGGVEYENCEHCDGTGIEPDDEEEDDDE